MAEVLILPILVNDLLDARHKFFRLRRVLRFSRTALRCYYANIRSISRKDIDLYVFSGTWLKYYGIVLRVIASSIFDFHVLRCDRK